MGKLSHLKKAIDGAKRRVYQGSPHKYDGKLDPSKIGAGEGAQAYGYGHYLAEAEDVAKGYQDRFKGRQVDLDDGTSLAYGDHWTNVRDAVQKEYKLHPDQAGQIAKSVIDDNLIDADIVGVGQFEDAYKFAIKQNKNATESLAHLYEFDIPESAIDNMLDWDAPVSEQPERIQEAISKARDNIRKLSPEYADNMDITGEGLYQLYSEYRGGSSQAASEGLKELGITGIKYHDGMSRAAGEGTRNFVIFPGNEDMVKAVSRNGEKLSAAALAPLAGIGLMGTFSEDSQAGVGGTIKAAGKALDMSDVARTQRAADMGFDVDTVWYHGSADDIDRFSLSHPNRKDAGWLGDGVYLWKDPEPAGSYANIKAGADAPNVMPLYTKKGNYYKATLADKQKMQAIEHSRGRDAARIEARNLTERLRSAGYDGVMLEYDPKDVGRSASTERVVFDPENIRSVNAAFDPAKKDSADLLASLGGAGVLGAAALSPEDARAAELDAIALYGEPERGWRPTEKRNKWKQFKQQYVEPLGTVATSLASLPVSGLEGLGALAQGYGIDDAVGAMDRRQEAMTYVPGSESGRQSLANIGEAMEILGGSPPVSMATDALNHGADVAYRYGSKVHPKVGAALGATVKTLPEVIF